MTEWIGHGHGKRTRGVIRHGGGIAVGIPCTEVDHAVIRHARFRAGAAGEPTDDAREIALSGELIGRGGIS